MQKLSYEAIFTGGPKDGQRVLMVVDEMLTEVTFLEEEPAVTELLAEFGGDPDPVRFEYVLVGWNSNVRAYAYVPKDEIKSGDQL